MTDAVPSGLTVFEAIDRLRVDGYTADYSVSDNGLRCNTCGRVHAVDDVDITAALRVEGASDPADEALVVGLECRGCKTRGVLVAGYGPTADPVEAAVVSRLGNRGRLA